MKKLKLKMHELTNVEVLTRDQLKNVLRSTTGGTFDPGGDGGEGKHCKMYCSADIGDGEYFNWSTTGRSCSTLSDCPKTVCDTAYGPVVIELQSCN